MYDAETGKRIAYNCVSYSYGEIRKELEQAGP